MLRRTDISCLERFLQSDDYLRQQPIWGYIERDIEVGDSRVPPQDIDVPQNIFDKDEVDLRITDKGLFGTVEGFGEVGESFMVTITIDSYGPRTDEGCVWVSQPGKIFFYLPLKLMMAREGPREEFE